MTSLRGLQDPQRKATEKAFKAIINEALDWERRSGATFEAKENSNHTLHPQKTTRAPQNLHHQGTNCPA